jgi:calcineurin-like phosphoesterase family protein
MQYFTADWHLGHTNIITHCDRPFADAESMAATIHQRWNDVVDESDTVYVLGDVALGSVKPWGDFIRSLKGTKILVAGNHDGCWLGHRRKQRALNKVQHYLNDGFDDVIPEGELQHHLVVQKDFPFPGWNMTRPVLLSHLPYEGDSQDDDRYNEQRPKDNGLINLCGHVHNAWTRKGNSINVGVDVRDFTPVSEKDLLNEI